MATVIIKQQRIGYFFILFSMFFHDVCMNVSKPPIETTTVLFLLETFVIVVYFWLGIPITVFVLHIENFILIFVPFSYRCIEKLLDRVIFQFSTVTKINKINKRKKHIQRALRITTSMDFLLLHYSPVFVFDTVTNIYGINMVEK